MFRTNALCRTLTALSASFLLQGPLQAQDFDNRANIYGGLNYQMFNDDWMQHNDTGFLVGGEIPVYERWGLALERWEVDSTRKFTGGETEFNYTRLGGNYHLEQVGSWQPYLGVGIGHHKLRNDAPVFNASETALDVGIGMKKFFENNFFIRGDIKAIRVSGVTNTDLAFNIGIGYAFGAKPSRPVAAAPAPAPAARPAPPAPAPAPAPAPLMEVTLQASTLFDFDGTQLRAEGRQELDRIAREIRNVTYDVVLVTGHTDRIGDADYNQRLSQERANAVREYLVNTGGIPAARITARGMGESEPVTRPGQCVNTGSAANQIACLQPDRRVVVIVEGTRPAQ